MIRRPVHAVKVGNVTLGGDAPIVVQSMTNTDTADALRTAMQVADLARAGSELVRITVNNDAAAAAVPEIRDRLDSMGLDTPLVGDFHFNGHKLLSNHPACAEALAKYRINPGNVGRGMRRDTQFAAMIEVACKHDKPVRIGANWGSLDPDLLARTLDENAALDNPLPLEVVNRQVVINSALDSADEAVRLGMRPDQIVVSCKMSRAPDLIAVYQELAERCDYALHLGLTEAGMGSKGIVASTAALAPLLLAGIGNTIRISLTPEPNGERSTEVQVAQEILQSLELRAFTPQVTSCPGCGRTTSTYFQELTDTIQRHLRERMPTWRDAYPGVESMTVAVMGCVVNGPGESKHADIGISLPGTGERPVAPVYVDGERSTTLKGDHIAEEFQQIVEDYVQRRYGLAKA